MRDHTSSPSIKCERCEFVSDDERKIEIHKQTKHMSPMVDLRIHDQTVSKCKQCDYKFRYNIQLKKHIAKKHMNYHDNPDGVTSNDNENLISKTNNDLKEVTLAFDKCFKKLKEDSDEKCRILGNTIVKLVNKVTRIERALLCHQKTKHVLNKEKVKSKKNQSC